jgi:hypothetical protein
MPAPATTPAKNAPSIVGSLLWIDCTGGLFVGASMFLFARWLHPLFQFPSSLYYTIASANVCYGAFSLALAMAGKRPIGLVSTLAIANAIWGVVCIITGVSMIGRASVFGLAHILSECVVVFWLAQMEWRHRALIAQRQKDDSKNGSAGIC